ncbi:dihydrodiol dehydrogenase DHDH [Acrasis kona]|uniref:D-xylose 1-dehydrogenase (NADP(+), D-xylono-1,5-lactone-forming) n=1 Tax=Acrasis kona TaxID=1008807 RepID=A0AAW2Z2Z1_9EUKA
MTAKKITGDKVRYGVVAGGNISQAAFMPGVDQTGNSVMTALVTSDPTKADELASKYNLKSYSYEEFDKLLQEDVVDAFYIATPNFMHRQFAEPALKAGYHVLLEKPMEVSVEDCQAIINASEQSGAKLMIAYRLHFEPATLELQRKCREGDFGDLRFFSSIFSQPLDTDNHRAKYDYWAGPVPDMGTYPINAVRNVFNSEPIEVSATGIRTPDRGFEGDFDDIVQVTLKFPGERIAQFVVSYTGESSERYQVVGTKGMADMKPCYFFGPGVKLKYTTSIDKKEETFEHENTDQFSGETHYFSECIIQNIQPECDGEEGLLDVRIMEAVKKALETGEKQKLAPLQRLRTTQESQARKFPQVTPPKHMIGKDSDKPAE